MKFARHTTNRDSSTFWGKSFRSLLRYPATLALSVLLTVPSSLLRADDDKLQAVDLQVETDENLPVDIDVVTPNLEANADDDDDDDGKKGKGRDKDRDKDDDELVLHSYTQPANGAVTDNGDGVLTYTPNTDYYGTDDFEYTIRKGKKEKKGRGKDDEKDEKHYATASVTITVNQISVSNNPPVADAASFSVDEDGTLSGALTGSDADGDALSFALASNASSGNAAVSSNGSFTYAPNADYNGSDSFTFTVNDGSATSAPATVSISVNAVNDDPVITSAASATAVEDEPFTYRATASDVDEDAVTFAFTGLPGWTSVSGAMVSGTPGEGDGDFSFSITADDNNGGSATLTVAVTVRAVNDAPVADDASFSVDEDGALSGVLSGSDPDGDNLTFALASGAGDGSAVVNADGSFTYSPNADFNGSDSFTFTVTDGSATSDPATVSITIIAVNDAPVAVDDAYTVPEDSPPVILDVLANDYDVDGDALTIKKVRQHNGIVHIQPNGTLSYEPTPNFSGLDEFFYSIDDGSGLDPVEATVRVTVSGSNDVPVADAAAFSMDEDGALSGTLTGSDADGDPLTFAMTATGSNGTAVVNANGTFTYVPNADYNGSDSFTFTVNDGTVDSDPATVTITVNALNDAPVADAATFTVDEDGNLSGALTGDDIDGDKLTFRLTSGASNGTAAVNADGSFSYAPNGNYNGSDSFTFTVTDGSATSDPATVSITVNALNDAPVADADTFTMDEDGSLSGTLTGSDIDGNGLTFAMTATGSNGTAVVNTDGSFTYAPNEDYNGSDSFAFTVFDGTVDSDPATVSITVDPVNDNPVITSAASANAVEDELFSYTARASDVDGDAVTFTFAGFPAWITASDSTVSGTPAQGDGDFSFTVNASDGQGGSASLSVAVAVNPVNDAPVAAAAEFTLDEDGSLSGTLSGSDVDGDPISFDLADGAAHGEVTIEDDGMFSYSPDGDFNGADNFTFTVSDGLDTSAPATVSLTISPVNDAPVAVADTYNISEDDVLTVSAADGVLSNDIDVENDALQAVPASNPANGTFAWGGGDGSFVYTPDAGYNGTDSFTYYANDGQLNSATVTVTIIVGAVNDLPVANGQSVSTDLDQAVNITLSASDPDGDPLLYAIVTPPAFGALSGPAPNLIYTPDSGFSGSDGFVFSVDDGWGGFATARVDIYVNVSDDIVSEDVGANGGTVTWDRDGADGDLASISISIPSGALSGSVTIQVSLYNDPPVTDGLAGPVFFFGPSGLQFASPVTITVPYDPALVPPGVTENDLAVIRYDEAEGSWTALLPSVVDTLNHTVSGETDHFSGFAAGIPAGTNHAPTLILALPPVSFDEDTSPAIVIQNLANYFTDADLTDVLVFSAEALDDGLAGLFISNVNELVAIPQPDFFGIIRLLVTASDGSAAISVEMLLAFTAVNDAPALVPIADVNWVEDSPVPIPLRATDVEGDNITFSAVSDTSAVLHQILGDTTLLLIPLPNWSGNANITVTATDVLGASAQQTFNVAFAADNDLPTDFALLLPADQTEILYSEALLGQSLRFEWEGSSDADGEPVSYVFALEDENQTYLFRDTSATVTEVPYSDIIAIMDDLGLGGVTFWWSIWAVSGSDSVEANNGPFELTITRPLAVEDNKHLPQMFALHQNFPNPFNPVTTLHYEMPAHTRVSLTIYDIRGREVIRLVDGYMRAGYNRVIWNSADASGRPVPSGIYFARMVTPRYSHTIKMSLLK